jgi:hypothetical protein
MQKIDRPEKPEGRDTVSSSYELWKFRLERGAEKPFNDRINNPKGG